MNESISNLDLQNAMTLDSYYKTIDDYIYEKHTKNKNEKSNVIISGVKTPHQKYFEKLYDIQNNRLPLSITNISYLKDDITKCPKDYSDQIKTILQNNNITRQLPGYTKNDLIHELRYEEFNSDDNSRYKRNIPFPISPDFFK